MVVIEIGGSRKNDIPVVFGALASVVNGERTGPLWHDRNVAPPWASPLRSGDCEAVRFANFLTGQFATFGIDAAG